MATGIGGSVFFAPFFILVLKVEPIVAVGIGLLIQSFGMTTGVFAYRRRRLIDVRLLKKGIIIATPLLILGTLVGETMPTSYFRLVFALGMLVLGLTLIDFFSFFRKKNLMKNSHLHFINAKDDEHLKDHYGNEYSYYHPKNIFYTLFTGVGAFFESLISAGGGEITSFFFINMVKIPTKIAVATSVCIVAFISILSSLGHSLFFISNATPATMSQVLSIVMFAIPGVIIGANIGPLIAHRIPGQKLKLLLGHVFVLIGLLYLTLILTSRV